MIERSKFLLSAYENKGKTYLSNERDKKKRKKHLTLSLSRLRPFQYLYSDEIVRQGCLFINSVSDACWVLIEIGTGPLHRRAETSPSRREEGKEEEGDEEEGMAAPPHRRVAASQSLQKTLLHWLPHPPIRLLIQDSLSALLGSHFLYLLFR